jgi:alkylhydroperoxidase/carboxymuconolactone decarboxylase family protein YurZ
LHADSPFKIIKENNMLSEIQMKSFNEFYNTARKNKTLDEKTTFLIHLAASMAVACYPCMKHYLSQADDLGITEEEIGTVLSIVMAVSSGRVMMQFNEASGQEPSPPETKCTETC